MPKKAMNIGMVKEFLKLLDEAVSPVMVRVRMIESSNRILAQHDVEAQLGIPKLREELKRAEEKVEVIKKMMADRGCGDNSGYGRSRNVDAKRRFDAMVAETVKKYNREEVAEFLATVAAAKEQITLSVFPEEVKVVLKNVREVSDSLGPKLIAAEEKATKLLRSRRLEKEDED